MNKAHVTYYRELLNDDNPDASYLEQDGWEDRLAEYRNGDFGYVGVRAVADIHVPHGRAWIVTKLKSPGLWGVESDSGEGYFNEVYEEERRILADMIRSLHDIEA